MTNFPRVTAFAGHSRIAAGPLDQIAVELWQRPAASDEPVHLTFDDRTGRVVDLDLRGPAVAILERLGRAYPPTTPDTPRGPGRPRLGVVAREVTLLPHHWDWLATQRGGASAALRRLVDDARRTVGAGDSLREAEERTYRFIHAIAGDLPGFEEATRALFGHDETGFAERISDWPVDIREYALWLLTGPG